MKLYLSSYRFGNRVDLIRANRSGARAAVVMNAQDASATARAERLGVQFEGLQRLGYECTELDLRDYFGTANELNKQLRQLDMVWVTGGNAFVLARAMTMSGFGEAAKDLIEKSQLLYAGYSAGACVAGPDLAGIDLMDQPHVLPDGYDPKAPATCLGLVPYRIVPHWRSEHPESADAERSADYLEAAGHTHRTLSDGQAIFIDGDKTTVVG